MLKILKKKNKKKQLIEFEFEKWVEKKFPVNFNIKNNNLLEIEIFVPTRNFI